MKPASVAVFVMAQDGHFESLRPLVDGLAGQGLAVHVFTDQAFASRVEEAGGRFVDVFARYPLDRADDESFPRPSRFVSFAAAYADSIVDDLAEIRPSLVVYDAHAVVGRVVGRALGVPYVCVATAHNVQPARLPALLDTLPPVRVSDACARAVDTLRERYGIEDASPFSFAGGLSPFLNVYCEPAAYLSEAERRGFEPVAFHSCLPSLDEIRSRGPVANGSWFGDAGGARRVYVSFGTVVWRYWPAEALDAIRALAEALGRMRDVRAVISLGGADLGAEATRALARPNVSIVDYLDQWEVLQEADVFVTHHGLRSTHEAIFHGVPMVSYPVFWDQPALAERCQRLGFAVPLVDSVRGRVREEDVEAAFAELSRREAEIRASLARARDWELETMAERDSVLRRITELIAG